MRKKATFGVLCCAHHLKAFREGHDPLRLHLPPTGGQLVNGFDDKRSWAPNSNFKTMKNKGAAKNKTTADVGQHERLGPKPIIAGGRSGIGETARGLGRRNQ